MGDKLLHSKISPSQAERFFECPGSVALQNSIQIDEPSSIAALEGTAIHDLAAKCLRPGETDPFKYLGDVITVHDNSGETVEFTVTDEFVAAVKLYTDTIDKYLETAGVDRGVLQIEAEFSIPEVDKDARGTTDCSFIAGDTLYVFDLKGGRGVLVSPVENRQCLYYALRPYLDAKMFISKIVIGIIQPRAKSGDYIKIWETTPERLEQFMGELKTAIAAVRQRNPKLNPGKYCRFCRAEGLCPELRSKMLTKVEDVLPEYVDAVPKISKLTPENIGKMLPALSILKGILENIESYALTIAKSGKEVPGYTLVKTKKLRRYKDEEAVKTEFERDYGTDIYDVTLKSPAKLEKLVGKTALENFVWVPEGDLKLVPTQESKEYVSRMVEDVFKDVKFE